MKTRYVSSAMQARLDESSLTLCRLLKITTTQDEVFGITSLDRDVLYDDGLSGHGEINYIASNGFDPSAIVADLGLSVGNAEGYALLSDSIPGVTEEKVNAGEFDDATWICYMVDYNNLGLGHVILDAGDLGDIRTRYGRTWVPELLSYVMRLKQPIGSVWSRTCRAVFGTPAASQTGCGVDIAPLWVSGTVQSVGAETDRIFVGDAVATFPSNTYPGRVQFLTGANAGREYATEEINGLEVSMIETTAYPIEVGDTYRIRPDCQKHYIDDCIGLYNNGPNFKGEPYIPVGDGQQGQTPGAQLPGGGGSKFTS